MPDNQTFPAVIIREIDGAFKFAVEQTDTGALPPGDVLVRVHYSSLNYKDALSATGNRGVTRKYPHTPGIDAAGEVVSSSSPDFAPGDKVIVTGNDLGQNTSGGWGGYISVPAGWVVPLPEGLSLRESMVMGTAGFTAAQCVERIVGHGVEPGDGEVVVTGATGGVGCLAVAMLAKLGYDVVAVTGKQDKENWLRELGATRIAGREEVSDYSGKPLLSGKWAAAVDTVGGNTLSTLVRQTIHRGIVTAVGNAGGADLPLTVFPFILRGVTLAGVDSAACPGRNRERIWSRLAIDWKLANLERLTREVTLDGLEKEVEAILAGQIAGRVVIKHSDSV